MDNVQDVLIANYISNHFKNLLQHVQTAALFDDYEVHIVMEVEINDRAYLHDLLEVFLQFRRVNLDSLFQTFTFIFFGNGLKVFKYLWNDDRNMSDILELFQYFIFFLVALLVIFVVNPFLLDHVTNVLDGTRFKPVAHFVDIG